MSHQYLTPYLEWPLTTTSLQKLFFMLSLSARVPYGHACFSSNNFYINSWWAVFIVTWHIFSKTVRKDWYNTIFFNAFPVTVIRKLICTIQKLQACSVFWMVWSTSLAAWIPKPEWEPQREERALREMMNFVLRTWHRIKWTFCSIGKCLQVQSIRRADDANCLLNMFQFFCCSRLL